MNKQNKKSGKRHVRSLGVTLAVLLGVGVLAAASRFATRGADSEDAYVFYRVHQTDLPIVVTERGNLRSQVKTIVRCEVENVGVDRGGNYGTQIIFIVPNGAAVAKGDLIVELDSAAIRDRLDTQTLNYQKAISAKTQATAKYTNQLLQNLTAEAEAELDVKLSELELDMYMDEESGTFQLSVEEIERQIDNTKNATLEARAQLELARVDRSGMKDLFELGYRGKSDLDQSRLKFLQAEDRLASSVNQMKTYQGNRRKLTRYEFQMQKLRLEGAVETAVRNQEQVQNDNQSVEEQALAAKLEAENTEKKELERLERLTQQLDRCKIVAPHSGMVVYERDRHGNLEAFEGATVRERQALLTLPDLSLMQVKTQIHEAVLDQVRKDMPATIRVDAFPDLTLDAIVSDVAVVPSSSGSWFSSSSVKTYETIVNILGKVDRLKPGMTAVVSIHVDRVTDILAVPVQSVVQVERETWCYVKTDNGVERRDVHLGKSNDKFVHVCKGLSEGDLVVLNPMGIFDQQQQGNPNSISPEAGEPELPEATSETAQAAARTASPQRVSKGSAVSKNGDPKKRPQLAEGQPAQRTKRRGQQVETAEDQPVPRRRKPTKSTVDRAASPPSSVRQLPTAT